MVHEAVAQVAVAAQMVGVVVALEHAVVEHHPVHLFGHVRLQHRRGQLAVVVRRQFVADVVHQRGDDPIDVGAREPRPSRRLERVFEARDW